MTNYRASDGTIFTDPNDFQNYENSNKYSFKNRDGEMLNKISGEIDFHAFLCTHLIDCEIILADGIGPIEIQDVHKCKIFIGACKSKIKISRMNGCKIVAAAIELEIEECSDCHFSVYTATAPRIHFGTCHDLTFGPFMGGYDDQKDHLLAAGLDISYTNNQWFKAISPDAFIMPINSIASNTEIIQFLQQHNIRLLEQDEVERVQDIYESEDYDEDDQELMKTMPWMPLGEADNVIPFTFPDTETELEEESNIDNNTKKNYGGETLPIEIQMNAETQENPDDNEHGGTNDNYYQVTTTRGGNHQQENNILPTNTTTDTVQRIDSLSEDITAQTEEKDKNIMTTSTSVPNEGTTSLGTNSIYHELSHHKSSKLNRMIWEKREEEEKHVNECKIKAKEDLLRFYNEKQLGKEKRQQINRELEKLKWEKEEEIFSVTNSYERILSLIDIQEDKRAIHNASQYFTKHSPQRAKVDNITSTQNSKKSNLGNTFAIVSGGGIGLQDISRFRSVLISCKESYNENDI